MEHTDSEVFTVVGATASHPEFTATDTFTASFTAPHLPSPDLTITLAPLAQLIEHAAITKSVFGGQDDNPPYVAPTAAGSHHRVRIHDYPDP